MFDCVSDSLSDGGDTGDTLGSADYENLGRPFQEEKDFLHLLFAGEVGLAVIVEPFDITKALLDDLGLTILHSLEYALLLEYELVFRGHVCYHELVRLPMHDMALAAAFLVVVAFAIRVNRLLQIPFGLAHLKLLLLPLRALGQPLKELLVVLAP